MNAIFTVVFLISTLLLLCTSPDLFLSALLDGAGKGAGICVSLVATYSVWLGLMRVWEDSGVARHISRFTKPLARKLFKTDNEEALQAISMNLSVNLLGISGAATPYGIRAATLLDKTENAEYSSAMLFVLNATSIQLIPTAIIGVRVAMHSASPNYVVIPTLLATLLSTFLGIILTRLFIPPHKPAATEKSSFFYPKTVKSRGQV
ncbi:MAG: nucleoside recognition protein [Clostridia bacterium]|nr:nucleoside recognition protein [Clostridia bacterium]